MKVLVTGAAGQLGYETVNESVRCGHKVLASDIKESYAFKDMDRANLSYCKIDITNKSEVERVFDIFRPDAVIHCAAWTKVDLAEEQKWHDFTYAVNVTGTENIAQACKKTDSKMIYVSTEYVFDGKGSKAWDPDCKMTAPLNIYGKTKLEGEKAVENLLKKYYIIRTSGMFGENGHNFVRTMLEKRKKHDIIQIVNDQFFTPTYADDLAHLFIKMINTDKYGYYHATNEGGYISWYEFALEIFRQADKLSPEKVINNNRGCIIPVSSEEYKFSTAKRPKNGRMDKSKLLKNGFALLPTWQDALHRYLIETGYGEKEDGTNKSLEKYK